MNGGRGVDCRGHSINEPVQGLMDYKNWRKLARYPRYKSRNPLKLTLFWKFDSKNLLFLIPILKFVLNWGVPPWLLCNIFGWLLRLWISFLFLVNS